MKAPRISPEGRAARLAATQSPEARAKRAASLRRPLQERFDSKVVRGATPSACWGWNGAKDGHGYGQMRVDRKGMLATHVSLQLAGVAKPDSASCALHTCDNPECCNPLHLYWGSRKQNTADARERGRLDTLGLRLGRGDKGALERTVQRKIIGYLEAAGYVSIHIPNGAHLAGNKLARAKQAAALRRDGLRPGAPDLLVLKAGGESAFLEVKREKGGELSPNQKWWAQRLEFLGHRYAVVRSIEDVSETLERWGWQAGRMAA